MYFHIHALFGLETKSNVLLNTSSKLTAKFCTKLSENFEIQWSLVYRDDFEMGACLTLEREEGKARRKSEEIDRQLGELAKQQNNVIKILLLGAGESGKSTLVKQMKIIHADGFTLAELSSFRPTVLDNLLASMKYVLSGMGLLRINLECPRNKVRAFS